MIFRLVYEIVGHLRFFGSGVTTFGEGKLFAICNSYLRISSSMILFELGLSKIPSLLSLEEMFSAGRIVR